MGEHAVRVGRVLRDAREFLLPDDGYPFECADQFGGVLEAALGERGRLD